MDDALLVLLGAAAGVIGTGVLGLLDRRRDRRLNRRVGALLILGDMFVLEAALELVEKHRQWPDRYDFDSPANTWREGRKALASAVKPWDWVLIDGMFSNLQRTAPMARPGEPVTDVDVEIVASVRRALLKVRPLVIEQAASSKRQRDRLVHELSARKEPTP